MKQIIPKRVFDKLAGEGKEYSKNQKERIARDLVKRIKARTAEGLDINEDDFAPYGSGSARKKKGPLEYLRRKERILGRKISKNDVDIKLFKKLLNSIKVKVNEKGDAEIFHKGESNNEKAFAHTSDRGRPLGVPQREYFGVTPDDIANASDKYAPKDSEDGED